MPPQKPRPQVNDLGDAPAIQPVARGTDFYARPGQVDIGRPATTNPLMQLSEALSDLNPKLLQFHQLAAVQASDEDIAKAKEIHYGRLRGQVNDLIAKGEILKGESPFVGKLVDRLQLRQLGRQYESEAAQAFASAPEFADARESNDPRHLMAALSQFQQSWLQTNGFAGDNAEGGKVDPYNRLDIHEILTPHIDRAQQNLLQAHSQQRIAATEKAAIETTGAIVSHEIEGFALNAHEFDEDGGAQALRNLTSTFEQIAGDHQDSPILNGGMSRTEYNQLLVDSVAAHAIKTRNLFLLDIPLHMKTNGGKSTVGETLYASTKLQAAREHIATQSHQASVIAEYNADTPHRALSKAAAEKGYEQADQAAKQARLTWSRTNRDEDRKEYTRQELMMTQRDLDAGRTQQMSARLFALRQGGFQDEANAFEVGISTVSLSRYKNIAPPTHEQDRLRANLSLEISAQAQDFNEMRLYTALQHKQITFDQYHDLKGELTKTKELGDHPYLRGAGYRNFSNSIVDSIRSKNPMSDPSADVRELEAGQASQKLRVAAYAYLAEKPQATQAQFLEHISKQQETIAASSSNAVAERLKERDSTLRDEHDKQQAADAQKLHMEKAQRQQRMKTDEGRLILKLPDGSIETEKTITFQDIHNDNRWVNWPTIFGGEHYDEAGARRLYYYTRGVDPDTGKQAKHYYSLADAEIAARERSAMLGKKYGNWPTPMEVGEMPGTEYRQVFPAAVDALKQSYTAGNVVNFKRVFGEEAYRRLNLPPAPTQ